MIKFITGKNINLRDMEIDDAEFVLSLRLDESLNKYISTTEADLEKQKNYIQHYKTLNNEYYFIIESKNHDCYGTVRIYDIKGDSFSWGSWIIKKDAPGFAAIESALLIYEYGFYSLKFKKVHFEVRKGNDKVIAFHQRFGAKIVSEDELNYYFHYSIDDYESIKSKYKRFLE